jgi:hypothetical protein
MRFLSTNRFRQSRFIANVRSILILSIVLGLIIWHTFLLNSNGTHVQMLAWISSGKVSLLILYNLALMLISGTLLGILMGKITALFSNIFDKK